MRHTTHTTQVYTLFGGGYVHEDHGHGFALKERTKRSGGKLAPMVVAVLFAATTAAGAIAATSRTRAPTPELWIQNPPSILTKLPGSFGFKELLF